MLSIELDSFALQARLPRDKLEHIFALLDTWFSKQYCLRKELESLSLPISNTLIKSFLRGHTFFTTYDQLIISVLAE